MSFCGLVRFAPDAGADEATARMRQVVDTAAAEATTVEHAAGWCTAWTPVERPAARARIVQDGDDVLIGDVPARWDGSAAELPTEEFALASWDAAAQRLELVRDHFGARALYLVHEPGRWAAFASTPEPLLVIGGVREELDLDGLLTTLLRGVRPPAVTTLFARLRRVPSAHRVGITAGGMTSQRWWALTGSPLRRPDPTTPDRIRAALDDAVRRRTDGLVSVGVQLSGGFDSSAVTAATAALLRDRVPVVAWTMARRDENGAVVDPEERRLAGLVAEAARIERRELPHDKAVLPYWLTVQEYLDRPLPDLVFRLGPEQGLLAAARAEGNEVLLSGWGGDEMLSYRGSSFLTMLAERRFRTALGQRPERHRDVVRPLRSLLLRRHVELAEADERVIAVLRTDEARRRALALVRREEVPPLARAARRWHVDRMAAASGLELFDWMAQRAGLPVRHPLQDRALLAVVDEVPAEWIASRRETRRPLRVAVADVLPAEVLDRRKKRLLTPERNEIWRLGQRDAVHAAWEALLASSSPLHQILDLASLPVDGSGHAVAGAIVADRLLGPSR